MAAGPKRRVVVRSGRPVGNIYERLEEARKKRAEALAMPKPANDSKSAPRKPTGEERKSQEHDRAQTETPAKDRLPTIKPPVGSELATAPEQTRRRVWPMIAFAFVVGILAYVFASPTDVQPVLSDSAPAMGTAPSSQVAASPASVSDSPLRRRPAAAVAPAESDPLPKPIKTIVPQPLVASGLSALIPPSAAEPPRQRPLAPPSSAPLTSDASVLPVAPTADTPGLVTLTSPADLQISLHVPNTASESVVDALRAGAQGVGIDLDSPRFVNFPIKSTHLRYFHDTDKADAIAFADAIGIEARDFTFMDTSPPEGYVELWVSGRAATRAASQPDSDGLFRDLGRELREFGSGVRGTLRAITR